MEWRVKIIRNNSIGKLAWNSNTENVEYKNIWFKGTLYELLNSGDYYNRINNYAKTGLSETAKNQISAVRWYLGNSNTGRTFSASVAYEMERGKKRCVEPADGSINCFSDDSIVSVMDKVGLMYPSDYLYTYAYGVDDKCYGNAAECATTKGGAPSNGWLYSRLLEWTITNSRTFSAIQINSLGLV